MSQEEEDVVVLLSGELTKVREIRGGTERGREGGRENEREKERKRGREREREREREIVRSSLSAFH